MRPRRIETWRNKVSALSLFQSKASILLNGTALVNFPLNSVLIIYFVNLFIYYYVINNSVCWSVIVNFRQFLVTWTLKLLAHWHSFPQLSTKLRMQRSILFIYFVSSFRIPRNGFWQPYNSRGNLLNQRGLSFIRNIVNLTSSTVGDTSHHCPIILISRKFNK